MNRARRAGKFVGNQNLVRPLQDLKRIRHIRRAWDAGHRVLYAPAASLTHHESKTRGTTQGPRELRSQARFWARCYALFPGKWAAYGLPPVMKSAMKHFGVDIGNPCRPYAPVSPRDHEQIGQFLRQVGLIGEAGPTAQGLLQASEKLRQEDTFLR